MASVEPFGGGGGDAIALATAAAAELLDDIAAADTVDAALAVLDAEDAEAELKAEPGVEAVPAGVAGGDDNMRASRPPRARLCDPPPPPNERRAGGGSDRNDGDGGRVACGLVASFF